MAFKDYATKLKEAVKPGLDRTVDYVKRGLTTGPVTASAVAAPPKPNYFGPAVGAAVGGVGAYDAARDMISNGAGLDNTTDFAGNAALAAGSVLSAPGIATTIPRLARIPVIGPKLATAAAVGLAGKYAGSEIVGALGETDLGRKAADSLVGEPLANQGALDQVALENPNGKLAEFRRGLAARGSVSAQAGAAPVTAPTAQAGAAPVTAPTAPVAAPATQQLTPQEVQGLRSGTINAAQYAPGTAGTGFVTNSEGRGVRFNAQPVQTAAPELTDPVAIAQAELARQAGGAARFGNKAAREASSLILANDAKNTAAKAGVGTADAALQDKRAKEFYDQFVNNAFRLPPDEKGVSAPDAPRNDQFLNFARENSPHFQTAKGQASLFALPAQEQNKIISELRAQFVAKGNIEASQNDKLFFQKPGLSSKAATVTGARESNVGDIPDIGLGKYLYSNLPFTDPNVVTTDRGAVLAEDFIGDPAQEGSYDRREKFAQLLKRGMQKGKVQ